MISAARGFVSVIDQCRINFTVGPITLLIQVPNAHQFESSEQKIFIHFHWNQEQGPSLFGFKTMLERELFLCIISCSGIGPKIALSILEHLTPHAFASAVLHANSKALSAVPGIGTKKAEHIIFNLKSKIDTLIKEGILKDAGDTFQQWHLVSQALESLNYSRPEIQHALQYTKEKLAESSTASFDQLMRHALAALSKQK